MIKQQFDVIESQSLINMETKRHSIIGGGRRREDSCSLLQAHAFFLLSIMSLKLI
jgi:hypothetical protein